MRAGCDDVAACGVPSRPDKTDRLLDALRAMSGADLQRLWRVSARLHASCLETLSELARTGIPRTAGDLGRPEVAARCSPAILAYDGIQYASLAPQVMTAGELSWCQEHLRLISGFYGCVRPLDAVLPYRLEMCAHLAVDGARDLYGFWGAAIAEDVLAGAEEPVLVNLASVEYAQAVLPHLPSGVPCVTCVFGEEVRAGRPVQRATAAKAARGSMVRWMAEHGVEDAAELPGFDIGYRFAPELSCESKLVFLRERP